MVDIRITSAYDPYTTSLQWSSDELQPYQGPNKAIMITLPLSISSFHLNYLHNSKEFRRRFKKFGRQGGIISFDEEENVIILIGKEEKVEDFKRYLISWMEETCICNESLKERRDTTSDVTTSLKHRSIASPNFSSGDSRNSPDSLKEMLSQATTSRPPVNQIAQNTQARSNSHSPPSARPLTQLNVSHSTTVNTTKKSSKKKLRAQSSEHAPSKKTSRKSKREPQATYPSPPGTPRQFAKGEIYPFSDEYFTHEINSELLALNKELPTKPKDIKGKPSSQNARSIALSPINDTSTYQYFNHDSRENTSITLNMPKPNITDEKSRIERMTPQQLSDVILENDELSMSRESSASSCSVSSKISSRRSQRSTMSTMTGNLSVSGNSRTSKSRPNPVSSRKDVPPSNVQKHLPLIYFVAGKPIHSDHINFVRQQGSFQTSDRQRSIPALNRRISVSKPSTSPNGKIRNSLYPTFLELNSSKNSSSGPFSTAFNTSRQSAVLLNKKLHQSQCVASPPTTSSESSITSSSSSFVSLDSSSSKDVEEKSRNNTGEGSEPAGEVEEEREGQYKYPVVADEEYEASRPLTLPSSSHSYSKSNNYLKITPKHRTFIRDKAVNGSSKTIRPIDTLLSESVSAMDHPDREYERGVQSVFIDDNRSLCFQQYNEQEQKRHTQISTLQSYFHQSQDLGVHRHIRTSTLALPPLTCGDNTLNEIGTPFNPLTTTDIHNISLDPRSPNSSSDGNNISKFQLHSNNMNKRISRFSSRLKSMSLMSTTTSSHSSSPLDKSTNSTKKWLIFSSYGKPSKQ